MRRAALALCAVSLAGCSASGPAPKIDPRVAAGVFCVLSEEGVVVAQSVTKGGAQASAKKAGDYQVIACDAATKLGDAAALPTKK